MIETLYVVKSVRARHSKAPLLQEREQYLAHLLRRGASAGYMRAIAGELLNVVRILEMVEPRSVSLEEIREAGERWSTDDQGNHSWIPPGEMSAYRFRIIAQNWLRFHGQLIEEAAAVFPFDSWVAQFVDDLRFNRNRSMDTIRSYNERVSNFFRWLGYRYSDFSSISLNDIDEFLDSKRAAGWQPRTMATQCQGLRTFFKYAETQGWCVKGFARGIRSPTIPKYDEAPKGPAWKDVRRVLRSANGSDPTELRAKALLYLFSIYGLRGVEVARLTIDDLDWRNETLTVRRAKRGRVQQYPIQYEVGEAILRYLQHSRPRCTCRNLFVTRHPPHRPIQSSVLWPIVSKRMTKLEIESEHIGPHALRHACATQLLKKGTALRDIADFLGHRDLKSVSIYAKHDTRSLRQVAAFSLAGIK
jgi:integrase/recombinase XerD